ncbi:hypothetical protein [Marinomonas sp. 2405UD68-3]|uniref:hypothetical protein n=1 Tax=Marinomonas sp. 2405UD68-3 TaxID=3391835 RepID=UPI0039C95DCD
MDKMPVLPNLSCWAALDVVIRALFDESKDQIVAIRAQIVVIDTQSVVIRALFSAKNPFFHNKIKNLKFLQTQLTR